MHYQQFLTTTLKAAAKIANEMYGRTTSRFKEDHSVVTEADLKIGKFIVAECVIASEAGATVTDFYGEPLDFSEPFKKAEGRITFDCCAAPPAIHKKVQEIIHR